MSATATAPKLQAVSDKVDFSSEESKVLAHWTSIKAFETSLAQSAGKPIYTFYDGPPFATGLPHYGHILAGTIKDIVTRYAHQTGHHVVRRFGWDCHGLPIEHEIDQKLQIKSRDDVMRIGVGKYNDECRAIVQRYTTEWESTVTRMGRWIDFKNGYKTMDVKYMESVWWVFSQLHEKGLVYRGYKVMPYSTGCTTPLSNFEAGLNYKDVSDPTVVVNFPIIGSDPKTSFVAWTTTPWTLPSNLALAVNDKFTYVKVKDLKTQDMYILSKARMSELFPPKKAVAAKPVAVPGTPAPTKEEKAKAAAATAAAHASIPLKTTEYEIVDEFLGSTLVGMHYDPVFPYFADRAGNGVDGAFRVISADYVTDDSGTGIVHLAPAFGEDDYNVCANAGIIKRDEEILCPVDADGNFTADVTDFAGRYVKEADRDIIAWLKQKGRLVKQNQMVHSYPFCWRSDTPLIYKAVPSWFINVEKIKTQLIAANVETYWVPEFVKEKRFHNWLADARDWAVSRSRYWGTPLPIWMSDDQKEMIVISSIEQLRTLSGEQNITDLHKDKIDHITIPSKRGKEFGLLKRVPEVFDCWFESGSMPYAQLHYPFENKEYFADGFPADFIAEGLDQTRGWFYTLMVISTALFGKPAFKNLIVNGLVLASDGKKMSKRLKNYPDPSIVVGKYGADALRLYLINSPVVRAEPLKFQEAGVFDVVKTVFLPWFHAYRFLVENVQRYEKENGCTFTVDMANGSDMKQTNVMDLWILSSFQSLTAFVHQEMAAYRLYTVVPRLLLFIEALTNWYVRMNRSRLKGKGGQEDSALALATLFHVLFNLCKLMAPFTPFFVDYIYQNLKRVLPMDQQVDCVHYLMIPREDVTQTSATIEQSVARMQTVIELGRTARDKRKLTMKRPLKSVLIVHKDPAYLADVKSLEAYLRTELNVRTVAFSSEVDKFILLKAVPNRRALGARFGKTSAQVGAAVSAWTHAQVLQFQSEGGLDHAGDRITLAEADVTMNFQGDTTIMEDCGNNDVLVIINVEEDAELVAESLAREVTRAVQQLRKKAGLVPTDDVEVFFRPTVKGASGKLVAAMHSQATFIQEILGRAVHPMARLAPYATVLAQGPLELEGEEPIEFIITRLFVSFSDSAIAKMKLTPATVATAKLYLAQKDWANLKAATGVKRDVEMKIDGQTVTFTCGTHFFFYVKDAADAQ